MPMQLVAPSVMYKKSFLDAVKEYCADPSNDSHYTKLSLVELEDNFESYVQKEISHAHGENLPEGYVPETDLWLVDGDEFIGAVRIRHELNDFLTRVGGHIGYDIRPAKRKMGYGTKILELALLEAEKLGLTHVLLTCDKCNIASRKIIEKNGGVFVKEQENAEMPPDKMRFWISL